MLGPKLKIISECGGCKYVRCNYEAGLNNCDKLHTILLTTKRSYSR